MYFIFFGLILGASLLPFRGYGIQEILLGCLCPVVFLYPLFCMGAFGAGDIKLFAVTGLFLGGLNIYLAAVSFAAGGVLSLFQMLSDKSLIPRLVCFYSYLAGCIHERKFMTYPSYSPQKKKNQIHFTAAVMIGYLMLCAWKECL